MRGRLCVCVFFFLSLPSPSSKVKSSLSFSSTPSSIQRGWQCDSNSSQQQPSGSDRKSGAPDSQPSPLNERKKGETPSLSLSFPSFSFSHTWYFPFRFILLFLFISRILSTPYYIPSCCNPLDQKKVMKKKRREQVEGSEIELVDKIF